jgi:flavin-dependent dehydrogenase
LDISVTPSQRENTVLILGGGPTGTAAAIELARHGLTLVVLERSRYDAVRVGETLPPTVIPRLHQLGIWENFQRDEHLPSPGIVSVWGSQEPYENDFIFNPYGHGWHIDRRRFDAMLAKAAEEAGATVSLGARVLSCLQQASGEWHVEAEVDGQPLRFRARFLVDATGRAAWLAQRQGAHKVACDRLVGVVGFLSANRSRQMGDPRTLLEAAPDGWWYSALLPQDRLVGAYMTDADLLPRARGDLLTFWQRNLRQAAHTQSRLEGCSLEFSLRTVSANSYRMSLVAGRNWLAVGDAAMAWDPLSSQGIIKAIESGMAAAQVIMDHQRDGSTSLEVYATQVQVDFDDYLKQRTAYYSRERRWPESVFWQRRQHSRSREATDSTSDARLDRFLKATT